MKKHIHVDDKCRLLNNGLVMKGYKMENIVEVSSTDYWFKVVGMLQQNWALVDIPPDSIGCTIYFIHDASGVFDQLQFNSEEEAHQALTRNGFARFAEDLSAQNYIAPPIPPFSKANHPNGPIYSSGRFWR